MLDEDNGGPCSGKRAGSEANPPARAAPTLVREPPLPGRKAVRAAGVAIIVTGAMVIGVVMILVVIVVRVVVIIIVFEKLCQRFARGA